MVVVSDGPSNEYGSPGLAGVLPPGMTTLYVAFNVQLAKVGSNNEDGKNRPVSALLIDAGVSGDSSGSLIEIDPPGPNASSQSKVGM